MKVGASVGIGVAVAVVLGGGFGGWYARGMGRAVAARIELPRFSEPGAGPRAPRAAAAAAFGAEVGRSTQAELEARLAARGIACQDRGVRAAMARWREAKRAEVAAAAAGGAKTDAVTGASALNRPTRHERNPQVRLSCEGARAAAIGDRSRAEENAGRLLFVFDSPELPLRHGSFERTFATAAAAQRDVAATVAALSETLGPPQRRPAAEGGGTSAACAGEALPWMRPVEWSWTWSDLRARVSAVNYGGARGVVVSETVEVPWPVRADAPAR